MAYFPLIRHKWHRKRSVQQFFYGGMCIHCCGNVFTDLLPNSDMGNMHTDTQGKFANNKGTGEGRVFSAIQPEVVYGGQLYGQELRGSLYDSQTH